MGESSSIRCPQARHWPLLRVYSASQDRAMRSLPEDLEGRVFTAAEALEYGLTPKMLRGRRFAQVTRGVFRYAATPMTLELAIGAALSVLPADAAVSHTTNLAWRGLEMRPRTPLHVATRSVVGSVRKGLVLHRYQGALETEMVRGVPVLRPARTFVDCGTILRVSELVEVGDWLLAQRLVDRLALEDYALRSHLDGVVRARRAVRHVRKGAESVRESRLRWHLVSAGLPEPELNVDIHDARGSFLARGDLVFRRWKVLVEYDGWYHERDAWQRQRDILRREALEAEGWRVIVVTSADMHNPDRVVARVRLALDSAMMNW